MYNKSAVGRFVAGKSQVYQLLIYLSLMALLVFGASLFGVLTRPFGFMAAFWPANALLLGLMLRIPLLVHPMGWLVALLAYMAPDLMFGGQPLLAFSLAFTNLVFVAVGVLLYRRFGPDIPTLDTPASVLQLLVVYCRGLLQHGIGPDFGALVRAGLVRQWYWAYGRILVYLRIGQRDFDSAVDAYSF
ncbi:MAG: hypothetical protein V7681_08740 [Halopseudomonas sabulinigri]